MIPLSASTTISRQEVVVSDKGQFLRLSDKKPGETSDTDRMTVGQAAAAMSDIFGKGTCGSADKDDAYQVPTSPATSLNNAGADYLNDKFSGPAGVAELAGKFGVADLCPATLAPTGKKTLPVYVHASSDAVFEDYRIVSYGSPISGPEIVEEEIQLRFEFTRSASLPIYYYIDYKKLDRYQENAILYGDMFEWRGKPKNNRGERVDPPPVRIQDGQVMLHGYYSGILIVSRLPVKYYKYMLTLNGTAIADGQREYKGRVSAISTAYGLGPVDQQIGEAETVKDAAAECPLEDGNPLATDPTTGSVVVCSRESGGELVCFGGGDDGPKGREIFCFIEVRKKLYLQCTKDYIRDLPTEYRGVDCPEEITPTWNSPMALNYNPSLPEYYHRVKTITEKEYSFEGVEPQITSGEYEKVCCHAPVNAGCLPYCRQIKSTHNGPVDIAGGRQKYIDQYHGTTVFIPVGTQAGPCGTLTDIFVDPTGDCCLLPRIVVKLVDNWLEIIQDDVVIHYSDNVPDVPYTIFLNKGSTVTVNLYNWYASETPWDIEYDYIVGDNIVHIVDDSGQSGPTSPDDNPPVFTKTFKVCA